MTFDTDVSVRISTPASRAASAMALEIAPVLPSEPPRPERPVDLSHVVVQEHARRPGERTPWNVPMMPEADIVAFSTSVSNH
jgi:hypothetical protein